MTRRGVLFLNLLAGVILLTTARPAAGFGGDALTIGNASTLGTTPVSMDVTMDAGAAVQGFVLAIQYSDNTLVDVTGADVAGAAAGISELVVGEFFPAEAGFTLGVVLDAAAPFDGQTIPAGTGQLVAAYDVQPLMTVAVSTDVTFDFVDGVLNDPPLNNILVQGGLSVGTAQGLVLTGGTLTLNPPPPGVLTIADTSADSDGPASVQILLDNESPVQGFVLAIAHDATAVSLDDINIAGTVTASVGAEFTVPDTAAPGGSGGTLGVVLDFSAPFDGQTIPAGTGQHIANFVYSTATLCVEDGDAPLTTALSFVDGTLGSPLLDNVIVISGLSVNPALTDGSLTFNPIQCSIVVPGAVAFYAGCAEGLPGDTVDVCFSYTSEDNVQGFQLAVTFDCMLTLGTFSVDGTIADAVGAEFVNFNVDNDPADGDGCELVAGILLDALPPFEGQTVPQTAEPLVIGCIDATISPDAPCDTTLSVGFQNGVDGSGDVPIENIAVIDYQSFQDITFFDCGVYVSPVPTFRRGDCNDDNKVDLADSATILGEQFFGLTVACEDSCDANDDGKINLADSVYILNWLFKFGDVPPAPGPYSDGPDATDDALGCDTAAC